MADYFQEILTRLQSQASTQELPEQANFECSLCGDSEFNLYQNEEGIWYAKPCECRERKNLRRRIKSSMLTEEMQGWKFDNYKPSKDTKFLFNVAKEYAADFEQIKATRGNGFGFIGPVGVGKTHLMASIANELLLRSVGLVFVNTTSLIYELRQAEFRRDSMDDIDQKIQMLQNAELVLFDDLAKEKSTEWTQMQYYRIIDHRYIHSKPTGWTSNCGLEELGEKLGDATTSRLVQMCGGINGRIVEVSRDAEDFRLK